MALRLSPHGRSVLRGRELTNMSETAKPPLRTDRARAPAPALPRLSELKPFSRAHFGPSGPVVASAVTLNILGLALPLAVLQIYDHINANQAVETLSALAIGLVIVAVLEFGLRTAQTWTLAHDAHRLAFQAGADAVRRRLSMDSSADGTESPALTLERFRALDTIGDYLAGDPRRTFIDLPFSMLFLAAIFLIGGALVFVPIAVMAVSVVVARMLLIRSRALADKREATSQRRADFLAEIFGAAPTVKGLAVEALMLRRFERLSSGGATLIRDSFMAASDTQIAVSTFSAIGAALMVGVGALSVISGDLTAGGLAACSLLAGRAIQPVVRVVSALTEQQRALIAAASAKPLFEGQVPPRQDTTRAATAAAAALEFRCVSFHRRDAAVLDEAELRFPVGGLTVLTADDADAADFFNLAAGLVTPSGGNVTIDGKSATLARAGIGKISLITPETGLFRGTLIENLTLFGASAETQDVVEVVELLGLDSMIGDLPAGYDTPVNAGPAEAMAMAHIRMIVLARALAQKPRLLLLDRPEMYLDTAFERRLAVAVKSLAGRTTVITRTEQPALRACADAELQLASGWAGFTRHPQRSEPRRSPAAPRREAQT